MDAPRIGRVLNNLVSNALRHTPSGGEVFVSADKEGNWVTVSVFDTGEGLDEEDLPYIFDSFYRAEKSRSRETGGVGLGLAISRGFVEAHGGELGVKPASEDASSGAGAAKGACFFFTLPVTR